MTVSDSPESNSDDAAVGDGQRAHDSGGQNSETKNQTVESGHRISAGNRSADGGHVGREVKFKRPPNRIRRATIAACFAVILAGYLQWNATATDHQFSNMGTVVVCFVFGCYILFQLHCLARMRWNGLVVPLGILLGIIAAGALLRFEGFSGELVPQYSYRFSSPAPAMRSVSGATGQPLAETVGAANRVVVAGAQTADAPSYGFLGNDRTAVFPVRKFSVPATVEDVQPLWRQGLGAGWSGFAVSRDRAVT